MLTGRKQFLRWFLALLLIFSGALTGTAEDTGGSSSAVDAFVSSLESDNPFCALDPFIFSVKTDHEIGQAFLVKADEGTAWLVSSSTVFEGAGMISITNTAGDTLVFPEQIQVAKESDAVRFKTGLLEGISPAADCAFQEKLSVFSQCRSDDDEEEIKNLKEDLQDLKESREKIERFKEQMDSSNRRGRYTKADVKKALKEVDEAMTDIHQKIESCEEKIAERKRLKGVSRPAAGGFLLSGEAVALGPSRIELSTPINRFDHGGPVLNSDQEVVGMNSYLMSESSLPDWIIEGTQFADARQFALKLSDVDWMDISKENYLEETQLTREMFADLYTFAYIIGRLRDGYLNQIRVDTDNRAIERWIRKHNDISRNEITDDQKDFVSMLRRLEYATGKAVEKLSIPYQQQKLRDLESIYGRLRKNFKQFIHMQ